VMIRAGMSERSVKNYGLPRTQPEHRSVAARTEPANQQWPQSELTSNGASRGKSLP
jgi:hypothetical protein